MNYQLASLTVLDYKSEDENDFSDGTAFIVLSDNDGEFEDVAMEFYFTVNHLADDYLHYELLSDLKELIVDNPLREKFGDDVNPDNFPEYNEYEQAVAALYEIDNDIFEAILAQV